MIAAACVILCVGVCGAGGMRAGMNYAKQRAEQTSEKEQETLWTDAAKADADTFSRELSQKQIGIVFTTKNKYFFNFFDILFTWYKE